MRALIPAFFTSKHVCFLHTINNINVIGRVFLDFESKNYARVNG